MGVEGAPFAYEGAGASDAGEFRPAGTYDDLLPLWAEGQYVPMDGSARGAPDAHVMTLTPV